MADADLLLMLSDVNGLYDANPSTDSTAKRLDKVEEITDEVRRYASGSDSYIGTGGMITKLDAAHIAMNAGCHMMLTSGKEPHPIEQIASGSTGTWFVAKENIATARKSWIAGTLNISGTLTIDEGAMTALTQGNSLLAAGVVACEGTFDRGDTVLVMTQNGTKIAQGLAAYNAEDCQRILGVQSNKIEEVLGYHAGDAIIHRDDMILL